MAQINLPGKASSTDEAYTGDQMKKVMVFGTFDGIHPGHEFLLKEAKREGDFLVVVVGRDKNIKRLKGAVPHRDEQARLRALMTLPEVDKAVLGYEDDFYQIIKDEQPDVICLGYDQHHIPLTPKIAQQHKITAKIIRLESFKPELYKSSKLNKKG